MTILTIPPNLPVFGSLSANYATGSASALSTGFGLSIIPTSQYVKILAVARVSSDTLSDGAACVLYRSTIGIPAQGMAPPASDVQLRLSSVTDPIANAAFDMAFVLIDPNVMATQTYYYYFAIYAITAGNATIYGGSNRTTMILSPP